MTSDYIVVSGLPGSGKTTLARGLAAELDLPLFCKDTIKEALAEVLEVRDVEASRRLGSAAIAALIAVAVEAGRGVLESSWNKALALRDLARLQGPIVEVFCSCPPSMAWERYAARAQSRHAAHLDLQRLGKSCWDAETVAAAGPLDGGWPVVSADTVRPVDPAVLAAAIRKIRSSTVHQDQATSGPERNSGS